MMTGGGEGTDGEGEGTIEQVTEDRTGAHGTGTNNDTTSLHSDDFPVALSSTYPGSAGQAPVSAVALELSPDSRSECALRCCGTRAATP